MHFRGSIYKSDCPLCPGGVIPADSYCGQWGHRKPIHSHVRRVGLGLDISRLIPLLDRLPAELIAVILGLMRQIRSLRDELYLVVGASYAAACSWRPPLSNFWLGARFSAIRSDKLGYYHVSIRGTGLRVWFQVYDVIVPRSLLCDTRRLLEWRVGQTGVKKIRCAGREQDKVRAIIYLL